MPHAHKGIWGYMFAQKIDAKGMLIHPDNWIEIKKIEKHTGIPMERWGKLSQSA